MMRQFSMIVFFTIGVMFLFTNNILAIPITATRDLPNFYISGESVDVTLNISVDEDNLVNAFFAVETIPSGWTLSSASLDPILYNSSTGEINWLFTWNSSSSSTPYDYPVEDTILTYTLLSPLGETGVKTFDGVLQFNFPPLNPVIQPTDGDSIINSKVAAVPEPSSMLLLGFGLAGLGLMRRRVKTKS